MDALLKRGERVVVPVTGMGKLDFELEKLKDEGVDLFHRCIVTKEFVGILNVLTPKKKDAVKLARKINAITQDAIVAIWKKNNEIHDLNRRTKSGEHLLTNSNMMKDARRLWKEGILNRCEPGRVSFSWQEFCKLSLKQKTNIVNKRKQFLELKVAAPIPAVGMTVRILYGRTNEGVKLLAGEITKIDLNMNKRRSSCEIELAADTSKKKELKLLSLSQNTCSKKQPFTQNELDLIDHLVTKGDWTGEIAKLLPSGRKNTKQNVKSIPSIITSEPRALIITDGGVFKKMLVSDALETCIFGSKMQYKTRRFRNKSEKVSHFELNHKLPILNCPLFLPDDIPWEEVEQSNEELLKGVAVKSLATALAQMVNLSVARRKK